MLDTHSEFGKTCGSEVKRSGRRRKSERRGVSGRAESIPSEGNLTLSSVPKLAVTNTSQDQKGIASTSRSPLKNKSKITTAKESVHTSRSPTRLSISPKNNSNLLKAFKSQQIKSSEKESLVDKSLLEEVEGLKALNYDM